MEGVNVFGEGHWAEIKSAYNFHQTRRSLYQQWRKMIINLQVTFTDGQWMLACQIVTRQQGNAYPWLCHIDYIYIIFL